MISLAMFDGRTCILVDDIVDSAGTLCNAAGALMQAGAKAVEAYVTHGVLSGNAVERVDASPLASLVETDFHPPTAAVAGARSQNFEHCALMAEAVVRISQERSVSSLFG